MSGLDLARLLLDKAAEDETLLDLILELPQVGDTVIGFHCQQAAEKLLKAVLSAEGIRYRRTHDLAELIDLATDNGLRLEPGMEDLRTLTPYAVDLRYGSFGMEIEEASNLDREKVRESIRRLRAWAEGRIGAIR